MSTFDLYNDDEIIPFAVDVEEIDAERIENALEAIALLSKSEDKVFSFRSNPADSSLDSIEESIAEIVGYLPANEKEAMKTLKSEGKNRQIGAVMQLFKERKVAQIVCFAESVAQSFCEDVNSKYNVLLNEGIAAQLIAARYKRFEKYLEDCKTIQFRDLNEKEQSYIESLIEATDVFFDIEDTSEINGFDISGYKSTLVLFKSDTIVQRIMEILATTNVKNRMESAHYAEPFLRVVYIATEIDEDLDIWMKSPAKGESLNTPYDFFPTNDNLVITASGCKEICQALQTKSMDAPALKLAINFYLQKPDGNDYFDNQKVIKSFVNLNIISAERAKDLTNKTLQIAYFAIAISESQNRDKILQANYSQYPTAKRMLKGIGQNLGIAVSTDPSVAYEYATLEDASAFDNYFHWGLTLYSAFYNQKNFSTTWYNDTKGLMNKLLTDVRSRNKVCDLIRFLREQGPHKRVLETKSIGEHPFNLNKAKDVAKLVNMDAMAGHYTKQPKNPFCPEFIETVENAGHIDIFNVLFSDGFFYNENVLHILIAGSLYVKNFEKVDSSLRFQPIKASVPQNFEIYHSSPFNPLSLIPGHDDFFNCCFTLGRQGGSAALASYFTYDYAAVCSFGFDVEAADGKKYPVMCGEFTSLVKAFFSGENVNVPQDTSLEIIEGTTEFYLLYVNPSISKASRVFSKNPNAEDVEGYAIGGSESSRYDLKDSNFKLDSAKAILEAFATNPKYIENVVSARVQGNGKLVQADDEVEYTLKPEYIENAPFYPEVKNAKLTKWNPIVEAYAEIMGGMGTWSAMGIQKVSSASLSFREMHVYFDEVGDSFSVKYVTENDDIIELDEIGDFNYLLYMFSFPKGDSFVPFQGSVCFHTDADADYCKKLLIPDWFKGKPLKRGNKVLKTKDLIKMRTPLEGAFVENSKGKVTQIL